MARELHFRSAVIAIPRFPRLAAGLFGIAAAHAAGIELSSGALRPGGSVSFFLSVHPSPGAPPAALQWSLEYAPEAVADLAIDGGPAATAAQKTVICAKNARGCTCLAVGPNASAIADGIVAIVTVTPGPDGGAVVQVTDALGASAAGEPIPFDASNQTATVSGRSPSVSTRRAPGTAGK